MEIERGFQLESPPIVLLWGTPQDDLLAIKGIQQITNEYLILTTTALRGLPLRIGLHLRHRRLNQIELMRQNELPLKDSFDDFQTRLEAEFGKPVVSLPADGGYTFFEWRFGTVSITHSVIERFVLQELVLVSNSS